MQLAGSTCRVCDRKIVFSINGRYCARCGNCAHVTCEPQPDCGICSQPFQREEPINHQPDTVAPPTSGIRADTAVSLFLIFVVVVICIGYFIVTYAMAQGH